MAAREAAEVAEAVQESNPNDYSNERGYANYSMGAYDQANVSSNAMALHESQPVEADSQV